MNQRCVLSSFENFKGQGVTHSEGQSDDQKSDIEKSIGRSTGNQKELYEDFRFLHQKYNDLKNEIQRVFWDYIPNRTKSSFRKFEDDKHNIPLLNHSVFETDERVGEYKIGRLLGIGRFAVVRECSRAIKHGHDICMRSYAVKITQKKKVLTLSHFEQIQTEVNSLRQLDHPNIIKLIDVIHAPDSFYIITESGGQDLFEFFESFHEGINLSSCREIMLGIVKPICYMHDLGYCHRDIKPENILLKICHGNSLKSEGVKICDLGNTVRADIEGILELSNVCGSPGFFAPEMIMNGLKYCGFKADIWSVGCVLLELLCSHDEFNKKWMSVYDESNLRSEKLFKYKVNHAIQEIHAMDIGDSTSSHFLKSILVLNPLKRLSSKDLIKHHWFSQAYSDLVSSTNSISNAQFCCENDKDGCRSIEEKPQCLYRSPSGFIRAAQKDASNLQTSSAFGRERDLRLPSTGEILVKI